MYWFTELLLLFPIHTVSALIITNLHTTQKKLCSNYYLPYRFLMIATKSFMDGLINGLVV